MPSSITSGDPSMLCRNAQRRHFKPKKPSVDPHIVQEVEEDLSFILSVRPSIPAFPSLAAAPEPHQLLLREPLSTGSSTQMSRRSGRRTRTGRGSGGR